MSRRCQRGGRGGKFKLTHLPDMWIRTGPPNLASSKEMILIFFFRLSCKLDTQLGLCFLFQAFFKHLCLPRPS